MYKITQNHPKCSKQLKTLRKSSKLLKMLKATQNRSNLIKIPKMLKIGQNT